MRVVLFVIEKSLLHDKPSGESGNWNDRRLHPARQHSAVPVGVQPEHRQVLVTASGRGVVGGLVMGH